jgi:hypothetical protein
MGKTMENHHFYWEKPLFRLGHGFNSFLDVYQRVPSLLMKSAQIQLPKTVSLVGASWWKRCFLMSLVVAYAPGEWSVHESQLVRFTRVNSSIGVAPPIAQWRN